MGFQNDKVDIFEQLGVFTVISGLDNITKGNSIGSINSQSKNLLPFFLDLLKASCLNNAKTVSPQKAMSNARARAGSGSHRAGK